MSMLSRNTHTIKNFSAFKPRSSLQRFGSTHAHGTHPEAHEYPTEGFGSPFWRNTVLCSLLVVGAYKFAPEASEDAYITRWIQLYTAPRDLWTERAAKHTSMSFDNSETTLTFSDANRPLVHRFRYPQTFEQLSPFLAPVDSVKNTDGMRVKGEKE